MERTCPECKTELSGMTAIGHLEKQPRRGDFTVCLYCGEILRFDTDLMLHTLTATDKVDMNKQPTQAVILNAAQEWIVKSLKSRGKGVA